MKNEKEELVTREKPVVDTKVEKLKIKSKKPKKLTKKYDILKVDLSKKVETKTEEDAVQEPKAEESVLRPSSESEETGQETKVELQSVESQEEKVNVIEEITDEEIKIGETVVEKPVVSIEPEQPKVILPENIDKLINFMSDTGGDINDYVRLNFDYTSVDSDILLKEYYKVTKPHLDREEVEFIIEDQFSIDEENDGERDIKKKKLAYKEEVAKATNFLEETKNKYYDEIKLKPSITGKSKEAIEFFDRYNKDKEVSLKKHEEFKKITKNYFNQDFKGFEFKLGEKKFRYGINNPNELADTQSDIGNFVKMFLHEDGTIKDHKGYHKAIYAAKNADTIAQHFYEQGKADAIKDVMAKSKNITNKPRSSGDGSVFINGLKVKAVTGLDTTKLKVKKINL